MIAPVLPAAALTAAGIGMTAMAKAIHSLYGMAVEINAYLDAHIKELQRSDNPTIARTGRVLEMAKLGFGLGYLAPTVVIATGQLLLGNQLGAIAATTMLVNPISMTCAAVGAIYFGWSALTSQEQEELLEKLSRGLEIGTELVKSIIRFVVEKSKELLTSKNLEEIKKYIASVAESFGKSLSSVTHQVSDMLSDGLGRVKKATGEAVEKTGELVGEAYDSTARTARETASKAKGLIGKKSSGPLTAESFDGRKAGSQKSVRATPRKK